MEAPEGVVGGFIGAEGIPPKFPPIPGFIPPGIFPIGAVPPIFPGMEEGDMPEFPIGIRGFIAPPEKVPRMPPPGIPPPGAAPK